MTLRERFWPKITDARSARYVAHRAAWFAIVVAGFTAIVAGLDLFGIPMIPGIDAWAFLDVALLGAVAAGIWRMSRVAAVAGLVVEVAEHIFTPNREVGMAYLILTVLVVLAFVNALRATFAYHRLQEPALQPNGAKPIEPR